MGKSLWRKTVINWVLSKWCQCQWAAGLPLSAIPKICVEDCFSFEVFGFFSSRRIISTTLCLRKHSHNFEPCPNQTVSSVFWSFSWVIKWNFYKLFVQLWLSGRHQQFIDVWFIFVGNQWRKSLSSCVDREHFKAWSNYSLPQFSIIRAYGCRTGIEKFFLSHYDRLRRFLHFNYVILFNLFIYAVRKWDYCPLSAQLSFNSVLFGAKAKVQLDIEKFLHTMQCYAFKNGLKRRVCSKRHFWLFNLHLASNKLPASINSLDHFNGVGSRRFKLISSLWSQPKTRQQCVHVLRMTMRRRRDNTPRKWLVWQQQPIVPGTGIYLRLYN